MGVAGVAIGTAVVLVCGCDAVFGFPDSRDAAVVRLDGAVDASGDGAIDAASLGDGAIDAPPDAPPTPICPASYGVVGSLAGRYRFQSTPMGWAAAQAACASDQISNSSRFTHLVVITPDPERGQLNANQPVRSWIGVSDRVTEGLYRWVTAEATMGYPGGSGTPWAGGEPDHVLPGDDCVETNSTADFAETDCFVSLASWCECDANPVVLSNF